MPGSLALGNSGSFLGHLNVPPPTQNQNPNQLLNPHQIPNQLPAIQSHQQQHQLQHHQQQQQQQQLNQNAAQFGAGFAGFGDGSNWNWFNWAQILRLIIIITSFIQLAIGICNSPLSCLCTLQIKGRVSGSVKDDVTNLVYVNFILFHLKSFNFIPLQCSLWSG